LRHNILCLHADLPDAGRVSHFEIDALLPVPAQKEALDAGISGVLTLDDGVNWRLTMTFELGILTAVTTAASGGATATWV